MQKKSNINSKQTQAGTYNLNELMMEQSILVYFDSFIKVNFNIANFCHLLEYLKLHNIVYQQNTIIFKETQRNSN